MMLTFHWKAPLQPKGFLKIVELVCLIIWCACVSSSLVPHSSLPPLLSLPLSPLFLHTMQLVAVLAFSLVAGFTATSTISCTPGSTSPRVQTKYPFFTYDLTNVNGTTFTGNNFNEHIISGQFFVAWGVLTMLYCIVAMVVYILFTANENLERIVDMLIYVVSSPELNNTMHTKSLAVYYEQ